MQKISNCIEEGSEGFFRAQYGTIFKLSFLISFMIMFVYYTREPVTNPGLTEISP